MITPPLTERSRVPSVISKVPEASTATPSGAVNHDWVAGMLSPVAELYRFPATVVMMPA